jgi:type II secretory pathway pseudopilin PulG
MSGQSEQAALQASAADEQLRQARRQSYYQALESGMQDEQNLFANKLTEIQSKSNLYGSAAKARQQAWSGAGDALAGIGSTLAGPGGDALFKAFKGMGAKKA